MLVDVATGHAVGQHLDGMVWHAIVVLLWCVTLLHGVSSHMCFEAQLAAKGSICHMAQNMVFK